MVIEFRKLFSFIKKIIDFTTIMCVCMCFYYTFIHWGGKAKSTVVVPYEIIGVIIGVLLSVLRLTLKKYVGSIQVTPRRSQRKGLDF